MKQAKNQARASAFHSFDRKPLPVEHSNQCVTRTAQGMYRFASSQVIEPAKLFVRSVNCLCMTRVGRLIATVHPGLRHQVWYATNELARSESQSGLKPGQFCFRARRVVTRSLHAPQAANTGHCLQKHQMLRKTRECCARHHLRDIDGVSADLY